MKRIFKNRSEAGQLLAKKLASLKNQPDTLVLALPRGGVPVGYEVAETLQLPLDILLVRKLGVPGQEELAMGAIAMGDIIIFNEEILQMLAISQQAIEETIAEQRQVLAERNQKYRGNHPLPDIKGRTIILVDDGIATGATMRAGIKALRQLQCAKIIVATPVAPPEVFNQFSQLADEIVCLSTPSPFFAIGNWYEDFTQTTDEEVMDLLEKNRHAKES